MAALAEKLGTHASNIQRWETDRVSPRHDTVGRIAEALGVGPADLVETEEERAHSRAAARHWDRELRSADEKNVLRSKIPRERYYRSRSAFTNILKEAENREFGLAFGS